MSEWDKVHMISTAMTPRGCRFQPQRKAQKQSTDILAALFQWDMVGVVSKFGANFRDFLQKKSEKRITRVSNNSEAVNRSQCVAAS